MVESTAVTALPAWVLVFQLVALVAALVVGARLLRVAARTKGWPETALGAFLLGQGIGSVLEAAAVSLAGGEGAPAATALAAFGRLWIAAASIFLFIATWRLFRPDGVWARAGSIGSSFVVAAVWGAGISQHGSVPVPTITDTSLPTLILLSMQLVAFLWWTAESAVYVARLGRQRAVGLASELVVRRCTLWVLCGFCGAVGVAAVLGLAAAQLAPHEVPVLWGALAIVFLVGTLGAYVSFLRPSILMPRAGARGATTT